MKQTVNLLNVYAPSGGSNAARRKEFYNSFPKLISLDSENCLNLLGGDFNSVVDNNLDTHPPRDYSDPSSKCLREVTQALGLIDIYRVFHPKTKGFTFHSPNGTRSRIDRFYVDNEKQNQILATGIEPFPMAPDHNAIVVDLAFGNVPRGRGSWKFNTALLQDQAFNEKIEFFWTHWRSQKSGFPSLAEWWDSGKSKIRKICVEHSKVVAHKRTRYKRKLEKQLRNTTRKLETRNSRGDVKRLNDLNNKLRTIELADSRGRIIRSRAQWHEEGERCTSYFANLERSRGNQSLIRAIRTKDNTVTHNIYQILDEHVRFYSDLYTAEQTDRTKHKTILDTLTTKLNDENKQRCEGLIRTEECLSAIKSMQSNKSPGTDGLPVEFYRHFWSLIGLDFVDMANSCYQNGLLAPSQRTALISTIFKKGDRLDLGNWRPISLCNIDYKIITKVLSLRLVGVLDSIINLDQSCGIKGRNIGHNVLLIRDLIQYSNDENLPTIMLSIDQQKAFDRVDWTYMFGCLEAFGFGPSFIQWIKTFYTDIYSCVKVNGHISAPFSLSRGVRQGCSLSAMLYVLIAETFACLVRQDERIRGIKLPNSDQSSVISQYADDTTLTLYGFDSVRHCFNLINLYERATGARINMIKTEGLLCGSLRHLDAGPPDIAIKWNNDKIKILGIWLGNNDTDRENWSSKLDKFRATLSLWKHRDLSFRGKVCVINQLAASVLWYTASILVMPEWVKKQLEQDLWSFFWGHKSFLVDKQTCRLPVDRGGQGVVDFSVQSFALKTKWIKALLSDDLPIKWRPLAFHFIGQSNGINLGKYCFLAPPKSNSRRVLTPFYKELFATWSLLQPSTRNQPLDWSIDQLLNVPLFDNPLIKCSKTGKMLHFEHWINNKIISIKDIAYQFVSGFLSVEAVGELFSVPPRRQTLDRELAIIMSSLPTVWRRRVATVQPGRSDENFEFGFRDRTTGVFRSFLKQPNRVLYCQLMSNINKLSPKTWQGTDLAFFFRHNYKYTIDNKVADLCWKIVHSGLPTAAKLYKWKSIPDPYCRSCNNRAVENTQHILWLCPVARQLWSFVTSLVNKIDPRDSLSYRDVVTRAPELSNTSLINFSIISVAKYSLWKFRNAYFFHDNDPPTDIVMYFKTLMRNFIQREHETNLVYKRSPNGLLWAYNGILCRITGPKLVFVLI